MATNFYFNTYLNNREQQLLDDLTVESIKMYGEDMFYIPRKLNNYDPIYGEDDQSSYEKAYPLEIYIKSFNGFLGDKEFYSKYGGAEIRDQVVFTFSRTSFAQEVSAYTDRTTPAGGDLIYFPLNRKAFKITFVQKYEMFYQLGSLQTWEVTCELFDYSNETFDTGIPEIDNVQTLMDTNVFTWSLNTEDDDFMLTDEDDNILVQEGKAISDLIISDDSLNIQQESDLFVNFTTIDPFSEGNT